MSKATLVIQCNTVIATGTEYYARWKVLGVGGSL